MMSMYFQALLILYYPHPAAMFNVDIFNANVTTLMLMLMLMMLMLLL